MKRKLILEEIDIFYKKGGLNNEGQNKMINILNGNDDISLRRLDNFVVKSKNLVINKHNIHESFKNELKFYGKKYFDIYRRHGAVTYNLNEKENKIINTSIAQLNFFKWLFQFGIIDYINKNGFNII